MNDEQKRKMKWLGRAEASEKHVTALKRQIAKDQQLADLISESDGSDAAELKQKVKQGIQEQQKQIAELVNIREEIRKAISTLHDSEMEAILTRRYLLYETNKKISEDMFFQIRTIQRKHLKALEKIVIQPLK